MSIGVNVSPWKVSLHGGHSGEFCDHADGTLREMIEAAVAFGYHTFGVTEHSPRVEERFLYAEERALGWTVDKIADDFDRYVEALSPLAHEHADRLVILRGFECEVIPAGRYLDLMRGYRRRLLPDGSAAFDYCLGSVHFVDEMQIDGPPENFMAAVRSMGGLENLAVRYYQTVAEMVTGLRPDVVGHFDLVKRNVSTTGMDPAEIETDRVRTAAIVALDIVRETSAILDLNTAGWRKGLGEPYPSPWLVRQAHSMDIGFCFGDDSHRPADVGAGVERAAAYLLANGVSTITVLTRDGATESGAIVRRVVPITLAADE